VLFRSDAYEEQFYQEAMEAFEKAVKFNPEAFAKCVAWQYLECYSGAKEIFRALGLEMRHAHILVGHTKEFWQMTRDDQD
jgi:hypothetical protein